MYNTPLNTPYNEICLFCNNISFLSCIQFVLYYNPQLFLLLLPTVYFSFHICTFNFSFETIVLCTCLYWIWSWWFFLTMAQIIKIILNSKPVFQQVCSCSPLCFICRFLSMLNSIIQAINEHTELRTKTSCYRTPLVMPTQFDSEQLVITSCVWIFN